MNMTRTELDGFIAVLGVLNGKKPPADKTAVRKLKSMRQKRPKKKRNK
ncbi:hypothetical protein [Limnobaculum zhutongyuii]|nr:hypothetical protein [Limnobaculum zhutongyuii]